MSTSIITPFLTVGKRNWYGVASNSDGRVISAIDYGGFIYTSTNYGVSWSANNLSRNWSCIACSSDGSKIVAGIYGGQIYTSSDSGATWTARDSNRLWVSVASSSNGVKLVACTTNIPNILINMNLQLWLDASDSSTIDDGKLLESMMTKWNDKSGFNNYATVFGGIVGYRSNGINNLPAIQIEQGGFIANSPAGAFTNGVTFFVVFKKNGSNNTNEGLISKTDSSVYPSPFNMYNNTRLVQNDGQTFTTNSSIDIRQQTSPTLYSSTINNSEWREYINGGSSTYTSSYTASFKDEVSTIHIGTRYDGGSKFTGLISEVIVYKGVLTTHERERVEGYLAKKWNLQLATNHPYYNSVNDGYIYTSVDSGVNWLVRNYDSSRNWSSVASSSDGNYLAACAVNDNIYSSFDSGVNWRGRYESFLNSMSWSCVALSSNGINLVAGVNGGYLYSSIEFPLLGSIITTIDARITDLSRNWRAVSSSSDGNTFFAANYGGQLYKSTDSGFNWIAIDSSRNLSSISCSSDATTLIASENGGYIYKLISSDTTYSQDTIFSEYNKKGLYNFLGTTHTNNGILKGTNAMPQKDITSTNENAFSMNRHTFLRQTQVTNTNIPPKNKKWIGGNRDSSNTTSKRRINTIGKISLNKSGGPMSFTTSKAGNDVRDAKHRVRSGGYIVPPAVTYRNIGGPIFY
jgi:hypothetical protein